MFIKKIVKLFFIIFLLFITFTIFEMVSISSKYINRAAITFDINNAQNPQIKKFIRSLDNFYSNFLVKYNSSQRKHLDQTDKNKRAEVKIPINHPLKTDD